jgi:hypothetical protein
LKSRFAEAKKQDPISKIIAAKWAGGMTQAVEGLPCKHEALTSNPSTVKKKKKKKLQE